MEIARPPNFVGRDISFLSLFGYFSSFEPITRGKSELVTGKSELVTSISEFVTRNLCFTFPPLDNNEKRKELKQRAKLAIIFACFRTVDLLDFHL